MQLNNKHETTGVLPSDLYGYYFIVDGMRCNDPNNVYVIRDVASVTNVFIIGGGKGDLFKVNNVPHGTVARHWYHSPANKMTRRITRLFSDCFRKTLFPLP